MGLEINGVVGHGGCVHPSLHAHPRPRAPTLHPFESLCIALAVALFFVGLLLTVLHGAWVSA